MIIISRFFYLLLLNDISNVVFYFVTAKIGCPLRVFGGFQP